MQIRSLSFVAVGFGFVMGVLAFAQTADPVQTAPAAQGQGTTNEHTMPRMSSEDHLKILTEKLNLTEDQQAKLKPVLEDESKQMDAIHEDRALAPADKRAKMQEIHESFAGQVNAVLTPEQQEKWKQMRQQMMEKHKAMEGQGPTGPQ
ncbi:MAG: hypothetical protein H0X25_08675 [Acidobacteriales bacterium]|nr:hypothetical protein [Terriglobales bacterium]